MNHPTDSPTWFESLFGFRELPYEQTQQQFVVEGRRLRSLANDRTFGIGTFSTPTLDELRASGRRSAAAGRLQVRHVAVGDILEAHGRPEHRGALFQAASQFNCLEFAAPDVTPEEGVTHYASDATQGPACAIATAAATVFRNYLVPLESGIGQTSRRQIDNLAGLAAQLGEPGRYWHVKNGYTFATRDQLRRLAQEIDARDREALLGSIRIGLQRDAEVTFGSRFTPPTEATHVSQAYCSACSCAYSSVDADGWEPLARLVLDAAYEATLWAAVTADAGHPGSRQVWLTLLGGGVFGNRMAWIADAIGAAIARLQGFDLDVRIAHHGAVYPRTQQTIDDAIAAHLAE